MTWERQPERRRATIPRHRSPESKPAVERPRSVTERRSCGCGRPAAYMSTLVSTRVTEVARPGQALIPASSWQRRKPAGLNGSTLRRPPSAVGAMKCHIPIHMRSATKSPKLVLRSLASRVRRRCCAGEKRIVVFFESSISASIYRSYRSDTDGTNRSASRGGLGGCACPANMRTFGENVFGSSVVTRPLDKPPRLRDS